MSETSTDMKPQWRKPHNATPASSLTYTQTDRQTYSQTNTQRDTTPHQPALLPTHRQTDRHIDRQTHNETDYLPEMVKAQVSFTDVKNIY